MGQLYQLLDFPYLKNPIHPLKPGIAHRIPNKYYHDYPIPN